jgi:putative salt-induced outer membrane protein
MPFNHTQRAGVGPALLLLVQGAIAADAAPAPKDGRWHGVVGAAFSTTSGNTQSTSVLLNADATRATADDKMSAGGYVNYAHSTKDGVRTTTADKASAFGQYDHDFAPPWFGFGRLAFDKDALIDLSLRSALSGGVGYRVIDDETNTFTLQGGLGYTIERYGSPQTIAGETDTQFSHASLFLAEESAHKLTETVSLKQRLEADPALGGGSGVLVKFNANLAVAMNSTMSLNVGVIDTYNSEPPVGAVSNDVTLFTGINVKFGGP